MNQKTFFLLFTCVCAAIAIAAGVWLGMRTRPSPITQIHSIDTDTHAEQRIQAVIGNPDLNDQDRDNEIRGILNEQLREEEARAGGE